MKKIEFIQEFIRRIEFLNRIVVANKNKEGKPSLHSSYDEKTNTYIKFFQSEEIEELNCLVNFILKYQNFNQLFSNEYVEDMVIGILHETFSNLETIQLKVENFYSRLIKNSSNKWIIICEVDNIKLLSTTFSFKFVDSTLKILKPEDLPLREKLKNINNSKVSKSIMKPCIFTSVIAGDIYKANDSALQNFNISLNLLRLYFPYSKPIIKELIHSDNFEIYSFNMDSKLGLISFRDSDDIKFNTITLSKEIYSDLQQKGIKELEKNCSITEVIINCLHWYGAGLDESLQSSKLLNFVTILESTLKKKGEKTELKQRVADRCALLLGNNFNEKKEIEKLISNIYNERNDIVHVGNIINNENIVEIAKAYSRAVLIRLMELNSKYNGNMEKFIDELDDKKYL